MWMMELQLTVNRLVNTVQLGLAVRNTSQTGTGQETQATWNDTGLIGDNITEQVAGDNDTVQRPRVLDHEHSRRVDQMGARLQVRVLILHDTLERLPP